MYELIQIKNGQAVTTSRLVAEKFGKQHKDVLRSIQTIGCSEEFNQRNFAPIEYTDEKGRKQPEYIITRDGFTFLAMGFTGKEAAKFKEAFIVAFNKMEAELLASRAPMPQEMSQDELAVWSAKKHLENSRRIKALEEEQRLTQRRMQELSQVLPDGERLYTVETYAYLYEVSWFPKEEELIEEFRMICLGNVFQKNIKVKGMRYSDGTLNILFPEIVLREVFDYCGGVKHRMDNEPGYTERVKKKLADLMENGDIITFPGL